MKYRDAKKKQIAKQLGVSVQVLEQYFQLKRAEVMHGDRPTTGSAGAGQTTIGTKRLARS